MIRRIPVTLALVLVLVLSGAGVGHAYWSAHGGITGRVATGTLSMAQAGAGQLAAAFTPGFAEVTAPIVVTNDGTVSAPFTLSFTGSSVDVEGTGEGNGALDAVAVSIWPVGDAAECASAPAGGAPDGSAPDGSATSVGWNAVPPVLGTVEPGESVVHCVRAVVDPSEAAPGDTVVVTASLASSIGAWSSVASAEFVQSFSDDDDAVVPPDGPESEGTP